MKKARSKIIPYFLLLGSLHCLAQGLPGGGDQFDGSPEIPTEPQVTHTFQLSYYAYNDLEEQLASIRTGLFRSHPLEEEVGRRLELFEETYTYYSEAAPGSFSDNKVIRKPVIYNSVYRIDRYYRKRVRAGAMDKDQAAARMSELLDKALLVFHYETGELEEALSKAPTAVKMISIFNRVELIP